MSVEPGLERREEETEVELKVKLMFEHVCTLQKATVYRKLFDRYASVIKKQHQCV